ncbi:hypothetical protein L6164_006564 [Bauhinia variegata]|uniref:Uncharacterized protein n=1 Tax=Bauhinia variegata TaxID=167791 RepID=A0ACB9PUT5_BAUVA|nr:hypothetical protein L6164_006564 [Bauhinia variegata]
MHHTRPKDILAKKGAISTSGRVELLTPPVETTFQINADGGGTWFLSPYSNGRTKWKLHVQLLTDTYLLRCHCHRTDTVIR